MGIEYRISRLVPVVRWQECDRFIGEQALERAVCAFTIYQKGPGVYRLELHTMLVIAGGDRT